jgi:hypothetical protein
MTKQLALSNASSSDLHLSVPYVQVPIWKRLSKIGRVITLGRYYVRKQKSFEKGLGEYTSISGLSCRGYRKENPEWYSSRFLRANSFEQGPQRRRMSKAEAFQNCFL